MTPREDMTTVIVLTKYYKIKGDIGLMPGVRLTDYMIETKDFIAMTDAEVTDLAGNNILTGGFLNVNRDSIEVILPADQDLKS